MVCKLLAEAPFLNRNDFSGLLELNPARSAMAIITEWGLISGSILLHYFFPNPFVYFITWLMLGSRMYALYALLHDGIHHLLFRQRSLNDWVCRILLAWPVFIPFEQMRKLHLAHHRHLQMPDDPELEHLRYAEFQFPQSRIGMAFTFLKDLTGFNFVFYKLKKWVWFFIAIRKSTKSLSDHKLNKWMIYRIVYYCIIISSIAYMGWWRELLIYWLVPYITLYQALNRLRLSTEHFHIEKETLFQTRTVKLHFLERFFLSPHNLGFHTEHHLFPKVPFYRLKELHKKLMQYEPYKRQILINYNYLQALKYYIK